MTISYESVAKENAQRREDKRCVIKGLRQEVLQIRLKGITPVYSYTEREGEGVVIAAMKVKEDESYCRLEKSKEKIGSDNPKEIFTKREQNVLQQVSEKIRLGLRV